MTEFISRKYGTNGFEIIIKTDSEEHYKATEAFARRLIDHAKPVTAADKIRAMSDRELASFFADRIIATALDRLGEERKEHIPRISKRQHPKTEQFRPPGIDCAGRFCI